MITFSVEHEHHELACLDAVPFDGTNPDELHLRIGDGRGFMETRKFARKLVEGAGLKVMAVENNYYKDCASQIRTEANATW